MLDIFSPFFRDQEPQWLILILYRLSRFLRQVRHSVGQFDTFCLRSSRSILPRLTKSHLADNLQIAWLVSALAYVTIQNCKSLNHQLVIEYLATNIINNLVVYILARFAPGEWFYIKHVTALQTNSVESWHSCEKSDIAFWRSLNSGCFTLSCSRWVDSITIWWSCRPEPWKCHFYSTNHMAFGCHAHFWYQLSRFEVLACLHVNVLQDTNLLNSFHSVELNVLQ